MIDFTNWHDLIFTAAAIIILFGLIPTLQKRTVMPLASTLPIFVAVTMITIGYATLYLWLSTTLTGLQAICWGCLAIISLRNRK